MSAKEKVLKLDPTAKAVREMGKWFVKVERGYISCDDIESKAWTYAIPKLLYPPEKLA